MAEVKLHDNYPVVIPVDARESSGAQNRINDRFCCGNGKSSVVSKKGGVAPVR